MHNGCPRTHAQKCTILRTQYPPPYPPLQVGTNCPTLRSGQCVRPAPHCKRLRHVGIIPRMPAQPERSLTSPDPYHKLRAAGITSEIILAKLATGLSLESVGREYGVSNTAILNLAKKHPEYRDHIEAQVQVRMEKRERELELAEENVQVTRADRLLGHARWLAERQAAHVYGAKNQLHVTGSITLDSLLNEADPPAINGELYTHEQPDNQPALTNKEADSA